MMEFKVGEIVQIESSSGSPWIELGDFVTLEGFDGEHWYVLDGEGDKFFYDEADLGKVPDEPQYPDTVMTIPDYSDLENPPKAIELPTEAPEFTTLAITFQEGTERLEGCYRAGESLYEVKIEKVE